MQPDCIYFLLFFVRFCRVQQAPLPEAVESSFRLAAAEPSADEACPELVGASDSEMASAEPAQATLFVPRAVVLKCVAHGP